MGRRGGGREGAQGGLEGGEGEEGLEGGPRAPEGVRGGPKGRGGVRGRRGGTTAQEIQTRTFQGCGAAKTPPKFCEKTRKRRKKE